MWAVDGRPKRHTETQKAISGFTGLWMRAVCCPLHYCTPLRGVIESFAMSDAAGGIGGAGGGIGGKSSDDKDKKRKQYQSGGANKRSKHGAAVDLNKGITGYLITCEQGKEQQCQREVVAWLTHYADMLYPVKAEAVDTADVHEAEAKDEPQSVSSALAAELAELKQQRRQPRTSKARFAPLDTGVRGIVFVHSRDAAVDHLQLLYRMLADITATKRLHTRYTIRIHPLHKTCFSRPEDLYTTAQPLLSALLPALPTPPQPSQPAPSRTFSIQLTKRGNHAQFDRDDTIRQLAGMWERGWVVDLDGASVVCVVEVCGRMAGVGLVERWKEFMKFNVRALGEAVYRDGEEGKRSDKSSKAAVETGGKEESVDKATDDVKETGP